MFPHSVALIVAVSENGVIGRDGDMPWRLPSDLKRFKALTTGHPVIMGRKTYESIGKPLPDRLNIVITRNMDWEAHGVLRVSSLPAALDLATAHLDSILAQTDEDDDEDNLPREIFIIGGGTIYEQAMDWVDSLYVTRICATIDGDTHFPSIDDAAWTVTHSQDVAKSDKDTHATRFIIYERTA